MKKRKPFSKPPTESYYASYIVLAANALFVFGVYLSTACPTVYLGDSGELTTAAFSIGVAHNSGYPLYVLLGKLFSLLPFSHVAFRLNIMSALFATLTIWLVSAIIYERTASLVSATIGALVLAFAPLFWQQSTCSEVYPLHTFFVAFLYMLLWRWEKEKTLNRLTLLAFFAGISFGNHLQTVMLAPAFLFIVLTGDYRSFLRPRHLIVLVTFFAFALSLYVLLPIRTDAGADLHWGDPNTWGRFLAHVTGQEHRGSYVFTKSGMEYWTRTMEILTAFINQFGFLLLLATVGWLKRTNARWKAFFILVLVGDLSYGVFLNIISVEVTPFGLPSFTMIAVLIGLGLGWTIKTAQSYIQGKVVRRVTGTALCFIPIIPFGLNYGSCDQSQNYLGYEHAINVWRTVESEGTLFMDGDNNIFPVMYSRFVEGARKDVTVYDRHGLFFESKTEKKSQNWNSDVRPDAITREHDIITKQPHGVYYAVFNPSAVSLPKGYDLKPHGILYKVRQPDTTHFDGTDLSPWNAYLTLSLHTAFDRDYMNRQVAAAYHFALGKYFMETGKPDKACKALAQASVVGYDDQTIHLDLASFFIEHNYMEEALSELEKALVYHQDLSGVYNNLGYLHHKLEKHREAITYYEKAISLKPQDYTYYNNLGIALLHAGEKQQASTVFQQSLEMKSTQPELISFLVEHGLQTRQ